MRLNFFFGKKEGKYYNGLASCQQLSVRLLYEMSAKIALFGPTTKNYSLDVQHFLHWMRDITSLLYRYRNEIYESRGILDILF